MGLDFMDIMFEIEKRIGVELTVDDVEPIVRNRDIMVGDLYDLLLEKLNLSDVNRHGYLLNEALWTDVRSILSDVTTVPEATIELRTPLESLFPQSDRREKWEHLRRSCPYHIRDLDYPAMVRWLSMLLAAVMAVVESLQMWQIPGLAWLWPLLGILGMCMFFETYAKLLTILGPLRNRFPSNMTTVKELCRAILGANYGAVCQNCRMPLDRRCATVWQQLTETLVDVLGVDAREVTFRSQLTRDLRMS